MPKSRPAMERFLEKVDRSGGPDACWVWTAARNRYGYGVFQLDGRRGMTAHRWMLARTLGRPLRWDDEVQEMALHTCDNPPCVNPAHLYVGTAKDNFDDVRQRGRPHPAVLRRDAAACSKGHAYTDENVRWTKSGHRRCLTCDRARYDEQKRHQQYLALKQRRSA